MMWTGFLGVVELDGVKGLGAAKIEALQAAGISSMEDLAGLDLRRQIDVRGVSHEALKLYKQRARAALRQAGESVPKAPYRRRNKSGKPRTKKRGWLGRLRRR